MMGDDELATTATAQQHRQGGRPFSPLFIQFVVTFFFSDVHSGEYVCSTVVNVQQRGIAEIIRVCLSIQTNRRRFFIFQDFFHVVVARLSSIVPLLSILYSSSVGDWIQPTTLFISASQSVSQAASQSVVLASSFFFFFHSRPFCPRLAPFFCLSFYVLDFFAYRR